MSPKLRPLRLPLLVEERRKLEESHGDAVVCSNFFVIDPAASEAVSPVTPTFSLLGHARGSSSASSVDSGSLACPDALSSPAQTSHKSGKRSSLPDVVEEPLEQFPPAQNLEEDDFDTLDRRDLDDLYDCLCAEPCLHRDNYMMQSTSEFYSHTRSVGYDYGSFSENDLNMTLRSSRKPRSGADFPFNGITQRIGSKFTGITKWRTSRQASVTQSPVSDFGFDQRPTLSRAPSSRSSSLSVTGRRRLDRSNEPPLPPTPALSFYESNDSLALSSSVDFEQTSSIDPLEIERERAMATTPLLPPFMYDSMSNPTTAQPSPLESPKIASPFAQEPRASPVMSPPLSTKPSVSSFHRITMSGELPGMPEEDETWCNLLGHANYTILPLPYKPNPFNLESLRQLRSDWDVARINYTKHLARTGEHYGLTSKTYALTEAKWSETKDLWRRYHDQVAHYIVASGAAAEDDVPKFEEDVLTAVPLMDTEGKFPERGDEDIVGPMVREASMLIPNELADKKNNSFWRTLAGRVGLRR